MKIYYKKTIVEKIVDANTDAKKAGKVIDFIALSEDEWKQVYNELPVRCWHNGTLMVDGIPVIIGAESVG